LLEDEPLQGFWFDRNQEHAAQRRGIAFERLAFATSYTVRLEPLPCWKDVSPEEYRRRIAEMVAEIESQAALRRQLNDLPAKGQKPSSLKTHAAPATLKKSPAPPIAVRLAPIGSTVFRRKVQRAF
jgi:hypothetical protein